MRRACLLGVVAGLAVLGCTPEPGAGPVRETPSPLVSAAPAPSASPSETTEPVQQLLLFVKESEDDPWRTSMAAQMLGPAPSASGEPSIW